MSWNDVPAKRRELAERTLNPLQLRILQLRLEQVPYRHIAITLGKHESTVRYHHGRALDLLRSAQKDAA